MLRFTFSKFSRFSEPPMESFKKQPDIMSSMRGGGKLSKAMKHQIVKDMILPIRIPALIILFWACYNTWLYNQANKAFDRGARFQTVRGRLLEIKKNNYFYNAVPRYAVKYEFVVNGVRYESCRATTGSFYRDWMPTWLWTDTITESQYLQAFPLLRVGEACTVFYDSKCPGAHAALACDANSTESGVALYAAVFPLIFANMLYGQYSAAKRKVFTKKIRVRMPAHDVDHMKAQHESVVNDYNKLMAAQHKNNNGK